MSRRNAARQMPLIISSWPYCVSARGPLARRRHAFMAADSRSWIYSFSSALGSAYVRSALAAVGIVQRLGGGGAKSPGLVPPQPCHVVLRRGVFRGGGRCI